MRLFCSKCQKVFEAEKPVDSSKVKCPDCGEEQEFPQTVPGPGVVVGDFLIEKLLSRGGMGEVFLAKQISLDRPVALKVLQQKHLEDREYVDSLFKEARAAAKLSHPNIVQAYAVGEENGIFYFAMEYIRGKTFKQILKEEKTIEFTRAASVIRDIARAIGAAWREQKLVHQDIKPDNIMLDSNGFAKLADLGLAKVATGVPDESEDDDQVLGTPQYISPEQLTGVPTEIRSDIYSLGATFYHFVTGRFPYVADTGDEIARMHIESALQPPKEVNPALPDELNRIIVKMMEKDINKRYQTAEELIGDLDAYLRSAPPAAKPVAKPVAVTPVAKPVAAKPAVPKFAVPGKKPTRTTTPPKPAVPKFAVPGQGPAAPAVAVPPAAPPPPVAEPPQPENPDNGEVYEEGASRFARPLKIALISVGSILILAVILMAVMVICVKTKTKLPAGLEPMAKTVSGWFGISAPAEVPQGNAEDQSGKNAKKKKKKKPGKKNAAAEGAKNAAAKGAKKPAQKAVKKAPAKAAKRPAAKKPAKKVPTVKPEQYDRIAELPLDDEEQIKDFLDRAKRLIRSGEPSDPEARTAYRNLKEKYERVVREEDEKKQRAEEEKRRREERDRRNYRELKDEVFKAVKPLVDGFYAAADGDDAAFRNAAAKADEVYIRQGENSGERKLVGDYRNFRAGLAGELKKFREFRKAMLNITDDVPCRIPGEGVCFVTALYPDGSADVRNRQSKKVHVPAETLAQSSNFKKSFEENLKDKYPNALFYYGLMTRRFDGAVRANAPAGFWKRHYALFVEAARSEE